MSPRDVLLSNIPDLQVAFADDCSPSQAYAKLAAINSPLATMPFNSFKTLAPIVVATVQHMEKIAAEHEQELAYMTQAYNHTLDTLEATLVGYAEATNMIQQHSVQTSIQKHTLSIQNSVCLEHTTGQQALLELDSPGIQTSVQKHTLVINESLITGIVQREINKAFKLAGIEVQLIPISNISQHTDENTPQEVSRIPDTVNTIDIPGVYKGWSVNRGADGYLRINRKIKGLNKTIHIGTDWNAAKAQAKIDKFMQTLGI